MNLFENHNDFIYIDNEITGFDFNPLGILAASIDQYGVCLISDIETNDYKFHIKISSESSNL